MFFLLAYVLNTNFPCYNFKSLNKRPFLHYIWRFWICDYEYFFHTKNQCFTIHIVHSHNSTPFSSCVDKNSLWNLGCVLSQKILFISECIKNCSLCSISSNTQNKQSYLWSYWDFIIAEVYTNDFWNLHNVPQVNSTVCCNCKVDNQLNVNDNYCQIHFCLNI